MAKIFSLLKHIFNFHEQKKQLLNLVLFSFLISFAVVRTYSVLVGHSIFIRGYQIHHFYFGMFSLSVGGLIALLSEDKRVMQISSILIGIGIGLFADEIGLLLNCTTLARTCTYRFPDSFDIIGTITVAIVLLIVLIDFIDRRTKSRLEVIREIEAVDPNKKIE